MSDAEGAHSLASTWHENTWMSGSADSLDSALKDLAACFASGDPCPGVGTAAGVAGAVAAGLIGMAAQLTCRNDDDSSFPARAAELANRASAIGGRLARSIAEDREIFRRVIQARRARDDADESERDALASRAAEALRPAIDLPLEVAEQSLELARLAKELADGGIQAAASDARAAVALALAGAEGSLVAAAVNLESVDPDGWSRGRRERCAGLWKELVSLRASLPPPLPA